MSSPFLHARPVFAIIVLAAALAAQAPQSTAPSFRSSAHLVVLDVIVTDKHNQPVRGLGKADFSLAEDGESQSIATFEATDAIAAQSAAFEAAPQTVLLIDELNTRFNDLAFARYSVSKYLKRGGTVLAQPTALMALGNRGLILLENYTRDPQAILAALDRHRSAISWRLEQGFYAAAERINISLGGLEQIAMAGADAHARKNIIWISAGLPLFSSQSINSNDRDRLFAALKRLSDRLLQARIAVYTIDPRGVANGQVSSGFGAFTDSASYNAYINILSSEDGFIFGNVALTALATQTGGRSLFGRNDVDAEVASSIADGDTYYTLAYYPKNRNFDGKFRAIHVALSRPDLRVRARVGYYALADQPALTDKESAYMLFQAMFSPLHYGGIVTLSAEEVAKTPNQMAITLELEGKNLSWQTQPNGDLRNRIDVAAAQISSHGAALHYTTQVHTFTIPAAKLATMQRSILKLTMTLPVDAVHPNGSHLRMVALDPANGRLGSVDIEGAARN